MTDISIPVGGGAVVPRVEERVEGIEVPIVVDAVEFVGRVHSVVIVGISVELEVWWVVSSVLAEVEVVLVVRVVTTVLLTVEVIRSVERIDVLTVVGIVE